MSNWINNLAGKFLVFDGPDGSGKTTQFDRIVRRCTDAGLEVCEVREPGGSSIGEQIRHILLDPANTEMSMRCEMLLYMASRAQLIEQLIAPARQRGALVLADRFVSSTLAYQGTAGGLPIEDILEVAEVAVGGCWPDLTVIFDVDENVAATRLSKQLDRVEQRGLEFQRLVRAGYREQAASHPERYLLIDAAPDADTVFEQLCHRLEVRFGAGMTC